MRDVVDGGVGEDGVGDAVGGGVGGVGVGEAVSERVVIVGAVAGVPEGGLGRSWRGRAGGGTRCC